MSEAISQQVSPAVTVLIAVIVVFVIIATGIEPICRRLESLTKLSRTARTMRRSDTRRCSIRAPLWRLQRFTSSVMARHVVG